MHRLAPYGENTPAEDDHRILSDAEAERIIDRIISHCPTGDRLDVTVHSKWVGRQRWARNRTFLTSNVRTVKVGIDLWFAQRSGPQHVIAILNQTDDDSLREACRFLLNNRSVQYRPGFVPGIDIELPHPVWASKGIPVWSDVSYNRTATENAQVVSDLTERAEASGMFAAGSLETAGAHYMGYFRDFWGREERETGRATMAECSSTVRHPKGVGSGWAGASSFDLPRIDLAKLGETAFEKCMKSINPVRIEPGRYQTILEPQAAATFAEMFFDLLQDRSLAEGPQHPLYLDYDASINRGRSKLGLQIADRRLNITHNPEDPISGTHPYYGMRTVDFLKGGVLTEMARDYVYSLPNLDRGDNIPGRKSFVMSGTETTTLDEMISSMKRGLLLTRVNGETRLDEKSALYTGVTRDGLWLIENGKITKAVRNFRWTESPLFIFNNIESIGESVPVMTSWSDSFPFAQHALQHVVSTPVVPTLKVNDFSFTSTIDAV